MAGTISGSSNMISSQSGAAHPVSAQSASSASNEPPKEVKKSFEQAWNEIQTKMGGREEKPREAKKSLGKDDFLKIMLTQLKHQDPTKPMEAEKMATEMAQLTSVEQLQNVNKTLEGLAQKNNALDKLTMAGLIGKSVTIDRNRFPHVEGDRETLAFTLPSDAQTVKAVIIAESGETIFEKDLGPQKAGEGNFVWDGKKLNTLAAKAGNYTLRIDARGSNQKVINPSTQIRTEVVGVSFEGSDAVLMVGNPSRPEKISLRNVIKIDGGNQSARPPAGSTAPGVQNAPAGIPAPGGNFFSFSRGEGSKPLDVASLNPEAQAAMAKLAGQNSVAPDGAPAGGPPPAAVQQAAVQLAQSLDSKEKGFPNGLSDNAGGGERK